MSLESPYCRQGSSCRQYSQGHILSSRPHSQHTKVFLVPIPVSQVHRGETGLQGSYCVPTARQVPDYSRPRKYPSHRPQNVHTYMSETLEVHGGHHVCRSPCMTSFKMPSALGTHSLQAKHQQYSQACGCPQAHEKFPCMVARSEQSIGGCPLSHSGTVCPDHYRCIPGRLGSTYAASPGPGTMVTSQVPLPHKLFGVTGSVQRLQTFPA